MYDFSVDYNSVDKFDILNIHKYLITKNNIKKMMFSTIKQALVVLLSFSSSLAPKCLALNDEPCMARQQYVCI